MSTAISRTGWIDIRHPGGAAAPPALLGEDLKVKTPPRAKPDDAHVEDWQRDGYGRVRFAANGEQLAAYRADRDEAKDGLQLFTGDWNDVPYRTLGAENAVGWQELVEYYCQRVLDLTAPQNPTLSVSQKALLWAQVHSYAEDTLNMGTFLNTYLTTGKCNPDTSGEGARRAILDLAKQLNDLEKQANLPNAEMKAANALMEEIRHYAATTPNSHASLAWQEVRP